MNATLIIPAYKRPELLNLGLWSLSCQKIYHNLEVIVLNDGIKDDTQEICNQYKSKLNIKYVFTGYRNLEKESFRSPSFALNIGIKKAKGDIIILSSPEIFHLNNTIDLLITPLVENKKMLSSPRFIYFDNTGETKDYLEFNHTLDLPTCLISSLEFNTYRCEYASRLPFCMAMYKKELIDIGSYDEDFIGWASDDDDIVERLLANGNVYSYCFARIIHLYHDKQYNRENKANDPDYLHNLKLFKERKGIIIRNVNKEWGINKRV